MKLALSSDAKVLYIHILLKSGSAEFYVDDISRLLQCSPRTSTNIIRELVSSGLVNKKRKNGCASRYEVVKA